VVTKPFLLELIGQAFARHLRVSCSMQQAMALRVKSRAILSILWVKVR